MPFVETFLVKSVLSFFGKYGKHILIIVSVIGLFFAARWYVIDWFEKHDAQIVKSTEDRKDAEWQSRLDREKLELMEKYENVRRKNKDLERDRPRNKSDVIDCLRRRCING